MKLEAVLPVRWLSERPQRRAHRREEIEFRPSNANQTPALVHRRAFEISVSHIIFLLSERYTALPKPLGDVQIHDLIPRISSPASRDEFKGPTHDEPHDVIHPLS